MLTVIPWAASSLTTGTTRASSTAVVDADGAGPGGLTTHVDDGGTLGRQSQTVRHRSVGVQIASTVGEGIVGDVHDPHHLNGWHVTSSTQDEIQRLGPRCVVGLELSAHR